MFYSNLKALIYKFKYMGQSFERYLKYIIIRRVKTYIKKRQRKNILWRIAFDYCYWDPYQKLIDPQAYTMESHIVKILDINSQGKIQSKAAKKRFLFYALKRFW